MKVIKISVLIAAFNVEKYIDQAVESCFACRQVREVIIVDDGSSDDTLNRCLLLKKNNVNIKVYTHDKNENHGAPTSWNLAISKATCDYIAILGADDWFLPNRFDKDQEIFKKQEDVDGVYSAILASYDIEKSPNKLARDLTTVGYVCPPENLFSALLGVDKPDFNNFSLNGLTVKREAILRNNILFHPRLRLHQDSHFCLQMAYHLTLVPSSIVEPVCRYRVHENNRITANAQFSPKFMANKLLYWDELKKWSVGKELKIKEKFMIYLNHKLYDTQLATSFRSRTFQFLIEINRIIATNNYAKIFKFLTNSAK